MSKPLVSPLDFSQLEALNLRVHNLVSPPGSPVEGQLYYDTTGGDKTVYFWDGTAWVSMKSGAPSGAAGGDLSGTYPNPQIASGVIVDADVNGSAAIAHAKIASPVGTYSWGSQILSNLANGVAGTDAINLNQLNAAVAGMLNKATARVVATTNINVASAPAAIDTVTLSTNDRVLLVGQTTTTENGIWIFNGTGSAMTRATDADISAEVKAGLYVFVGEGSAANANTGWQLFTNDPITLGSTALDFQRVSAAGQITAGAGMTKTADTLDVGQGTGIIVSANDVAIDPAVVMRRVAADVGDGVSTSIVVTHSLGTRDVLVQLFRNSGNREEASVEVQHTSTTTVTLVFATAPASAAWRCVVMG